MTGRSKFEVLKTHSARLWWSLENNSPFISKPSSGMFTEVRLTPPGDARPLVGYYYKFVWEIIEGYFYPSKPPLPKRKTILLNKVPYPDYAEEVILDGQVVGHIFYDLKQRRFRFKPLYFLVEESVKNRHGYYAVVDLPRLSRGFTIKEDSILSSNLPVSDRDEYIMLGTANGRYYGIGVRVRSNRIYTLKSWLAKPSSWLDKDPSMLEVVKFNEAALREKEEEAIRFIRSLKEKYNLPVFVSLSGGKDSLVTLHLAIKALGQENVTAIFNNTGLEFDETVEFARKVAEHYGVDFIEADAGDNFWRGLEIMGPPARDYRWCCKVTKFSVLARTLKSAFPGGAISLVGQRKYESSARAMSPRIWRNEWLPSIIAASPIQDWTALDIWLYIFLEKLPVNKLYYVGFDRLGCWLCPATELGEIEIAKKAKPELYRKWENYLKSYAEKHGLPSEWVDCGLWRWIQPPKDILKECPASYKDQRGAQYQVSKKEDKLEFILLARPTTKLVPEKLLNLSISSPTIKLKKVQVEDNKLVIEPEHVLTPRDVETLERVFMRAYYCAGCLECASNCPVGAISIDEKNGGVKINSDACKQCSLCNLKCPIAEYTLKTRGQS